MILKSKRKEKKNPLSIYLIKCTSVIYVHMLFYNIFLLNTSVLFPYYV